MLGISQKSEFLYQEIQKYVGNAILELNTFASTAEPTMFKSNKSRRDILNETATAHQESLRINLQRRMEAAKARGDLNLLRKLQEEADYIK
ncbi:MAG: hypothetical protein KME20_09900 [Kaiparowitsia implicata GSE-PSE-MK54-09C]|jgi:hypothetical protein|nr:hypothetical protein [Kaiparowitsia implicata GSE-PSE-MK54-09C]